MNMLTQAQVQSARNSLGITPTSSTAPNRISELQQAWGTQSSSIGDYASSVFKNLGSTFEQGAQGVTKDIASIPSEAQKAGGSPLADVAAVGAGAGHVAGDIAGTAGNIIGSFISPLLPDSVKSKIGDVTKFVSDKINSIPGMTPEIAQSLGDVFNTLALEGGGGVAEKGIAIAKEVVPGAIEKAKGAIETAIPKSSPEDITAGILKESGQMTPETADKVAWQDIQPKATPSTKLAYAKGGNISGQTLLKGGELIPTEADKPLIDTTSKLYQDGTLKPDMSPTEKQAAINQKAAQLNADQKNFLAENDKAVNLTTKDKTGLIDSLLAVRNKSIVPFSKDVTAKGAYDSTIQMFKNELTAGKAAGTVKGATTLTSIDKALTSFGQEMEKFGAWEKTATGDLTDTAKARVMAIRDIYTNARDFIAKELPPNSPWKSIRKEESNLYEISNRMAQRISETVGKSGLQQKIESNPIVKAGVGIVKQAIPFGIGHHL